jgi:hypothetical protein
MGILLLHLFVPEALSSAALTSPIVETSWHLAVLVTHRPGQDEPWEQGMTTAVAVL